MKNVIVDNLITSITADSSDAEFPAINLLDEHPGRIWKAASGVTHATLTCSMSAGSVSAVGGIGIFGTNADSVIINITDPNVVTFPGMDWDGISWPFTNPQTVPELDSSGSANAVWSEFDQVDTSVEIKIILSGSETLECGVVIAGEKETFNDPKYSAGEGLKGYGNERDLSNGAFYYDKKSIVRTFNGVMDLENDDAGFYKFMIDLAKTHGKAPKAMRITSKGGFRWVVYARFAELPYGTHDHQRLSTINYQLIEVI